MKLPDHSFVEDPRLLRTTRWPLSSEQFSLRLLSSERAGFCTVAANDGREIAADHRADLLSFGVTTTAAPHEHGGHGGERNRARGHDLILWCACSREPSPAGRPNDYGTEGREFESLRARSASSRFSPVFAAARDTCAHPGGRLVPDLAASLPPLVVACWSHPRSGGARASVDMLRSICRASARYWRARARTSRMKLAFAAV
jgi:hypothetical protein